MERAARSLEPLLFLPDGEDDGGDEGEEAARDDAHQLARPRGQERLRPGDLQREVGAHLV